MSTKINQAVVEIQQAINKIKEETEGRDQIFTVKPIPLTPYPEATENKFFSFLNTSTTYDKRNILTIRTELVDSTMRVFGVDLKDKDAKNLCVDVLKTALIPIEAIHQQNLLIIEENKKQVEIIKNFMVNTLGLRETRYESYSVGRGKTSTRSVAAHWVSDIFASYPTTELDGYRKIQDAVKTIESKITSYFDSISKVEQEKKKIDEATRLQNAAVAYLVAHGKIVGTDFNVSDAIEFADSLAYELEVESRSDINNGHFISFSGDDNCENCHGWDGSSHRCECGNRRVSWSKGYSHSFENPEVFAEAY